MVKQIKENWNDSDKLSELLIDIVVEQGELAKAIATQEVTYDNQFVFEKEDGIKVTDSYARAKARTITGSGKTENEYMFRVMENLKEVVIFRISQLRELELTPDLPQGLSLDPHATISE